MGIKASPSGFKNSSSTRQVADIFSNQLKRPKLKEMQNNAAAKNVQTRMVTDDQVVVCSRERQKEIHVRTMRSVWVEADEHQTVDQIT